MVNETKFMIKIAYYYYKKGLTQNEIAKKLSMSRQRVNRLLKKSKEDGIVTIQISGYVENYIDMEAELEEKFNIKRVVIVPLMENEDIYENLGEAGANYLTSILKDNQVIGVSWGKTLFNVSQKLPPFTSKNNNVSIVQLVGGMNEAHFNRQSDEITRNIANKIGAIPYFIYAPTFIENSQTKRAFMQEEGIKNVFNMMEKCDIAMLSVGELRKHSSALKKFYLKDADVEALRKMGSAGNICLRYFDIKGKVLEYPLHDTIMGIPLETLRKIPEVICVAGGKEKVKAIYGALQSGIIDTLITDYYTAKEIGKIGN